ncbi:MAG: ring-cleaving dioxygenase [Thermoanaerobaculia bacterium]|nr:ring-cleaving dioxygenase [Thermoanaerobaculia bacterium]
MPATVHGIHHITAIATDAQRNLDFYSGLLGLRLVKRTVNFDDPGTYHLYFGDAEGRPGTILTFFPWRYARRGARGTGQVTATAFAVPAASLGWWHDRLAASHVVREDPRERMGEEVLAFLDPDGLRLELVATDTAAEGGPWSAGPVPTPHAIRGFHSATLALADAAPTAALLTREMGLRRVAEEGARSRFAAGPAEGVGALVDLVARPGEGRGNVAAGSVHHIAWRVAGDTEQEEARAHLEGLGLHVTPVLDRQYFHSIYFREPGGVLFEIATDPPGFGVDEPVEELGSGLRLPPWLEPHRERIERTLPPLGAGRELSAEGA